MKNLLIVLLLTQSAYAGTYECKIYKNYKELITLVQTEFAENDPEEESEVYEMIIADGIKALAGYYPYQDGLALYLTDVKAKIGAEAIFDKKDDEYASVTLIKGDNRYELACRK